jgi:hypothetical protein
LQTTKGISGKFKLHRVAFTNLKIQEIYLTNTQIEIPTNLKIIDELILKRTRRNLRVWITNDIKNGNIDTQYSIYRYPITNTTSALMLEGILRDYDMLDI